MYLWANFNAFLARHPLPAARIIHRYTMERISRVRNRMGEICASGSVGGEGANALAYPATWAGDAKGRGASGSNREAESTDAPERGGLPRSSDEAG
jgi:hypothetical protein